ncbi:hypothetical protein FRC03_004085 [Tulasnella sp. 419]|nr:hypothetical protein FRC03_004085 [Tulasnella sp. 419]
MSTNILSESMEGVVLDRELPAEPSELACETIYIQNLNEKVKIQVLKQSLTNLFKSYGEVINVTAHRNLRMRGQAFVSFQSKEAAAKAVKEVKGFPLYGKPMQLSFSKTKSDAVIDFLHEDKESHLKDRQARKKKARRHNPLAIKARQQRAAAKADGTAPTAAPKRNIVQMPDEYLPPNRVLFIQNLPTDVTQAVLQELFGQYPNLSDVRTIAAKKDIAFVEYLDEDSATVAKDALHNYKLDGENKIKITYARK